MGDWSELKTKAQDVRRSWRREATWLLAYSCVAFSFGDLLFGIDTGSYGSIQALPSFLNKFAPRNKKGVHAFSTNTISVMNSIVWPSKFLGALVFDPLVNKVGYRVTAYICAAIQCVALIGGCTTGPVIQSGLFLKSRVLIQMTASTWQIFNGGRIIAYFAVGIVENAVPSYQSEIAPAGLRGFFAGFMHVLTGLGNLWGSGMGRAYADEQGPKGYLICTGVQFIPAVLMFVLIPFCPQSPRWLIAKGRKEEAIKALGRLRPSSHTDNGLTIMEAEALEAAIDEANTTQGGRWVDLLKGDWPKRVFIGSWSFFYNQAGGSQLINLYGPTFLKSVGYGDLSFTYTNVITAIGLLAAMFALLIVDIVGKRRLSMAGMTMATIAAGVVGGIGQKKVHTKADLHTIIASLVFVSVGNKLCFQPLCYVIAAELGGVRMRRKCLAIGTAFDVVMAFVVSYSIPYLIGTPGANLGAKVGYVFMGVCATGFLYSFFLLPELSGRSLEEVDEMYDHRPKLWAWQFRLFETEGVGRRITDLELSRVDAGKFENREDVEAGRDAKMDDPSHLEG